ncbi:hypothethical protein [Ralstonia solanacearum PSI07]|nr:hypothethical protein [Ralstonia solanacearum PSI07]
MLACGFLNVGTLISINYPPFDLRSVREISDLSC